MAAGEGVGHPLVQMTDRECKLEGCYCSVVTSNAGKVLQMQLANQYATAEERILTGICFVV